MSREIANNTENTQIDNILIASTVWASKLGAAKNSMIIKNRK